MSGRRWCVPVAAAMVLCAGLAWSPGAAANSSPWTGFNENDYSATWMGANFLTVGQLAQADANQGATVDRTSIPWSAIEPNGPDCEPGGNASGCKWASVDAYYTALTGEQPGSYAPATDPPPRIRPVFAIIDVPGWAYSSPCTGACPGWNLQAYANFAASLASRYPYAAAIEVWNEEDGNASGQTGQCNAGAPQSWCWGVQPYAQLLEDTYQSVHQLIQAGSVASDMKVLLGSLGPVPVSSGGNLSAGEWLANVYSAWGGQVYMDGIGLHPYPGSTGDDVQDQLLDEVRDVRDDNNDSTRPIYVTETGISTASTLDPNVAAKPLQPVNENEQALEVAHLWNALSPQPDIAAVLLHTLLEITFNGNHQPTPLDGGFGLLDNNRNTQQPGTCPTCTGWNQTAYRVKPAFCINAQLHGSGYKCPLGVPVPSLTAQPASGNFQAQIDLQAAYEVAREYYHQHAAFDGISNAYLNSQNPSLLNASPPSNPQTNNPGSGADPSRVDIVQATGDTLQLCNSGTGDTSYCISRSGTSQYSTPTGSVSFALPTYQEAVKPTTGDRAALVGAAGWAPSSGY